MQLAPSPEAIFAHWPKRLARIASALACPLCRTRLEHAADGVLCHTCNRRYPIRDAKIYFIEPLRADDTLDRIKERLKHLLGRNYYKFGIQLVAPTYPFNYAKAIRKHVNPEQELVLDLGCGNNRIDDDVITLDAVDYEAVDIVADSGALPFQCGTIGAFASRSVLEHLPNLTTAVAEIERCSRPGGAGIHLIPFLFPYHASPHDYQRLTHRGAATLFAGWEVIEQRNATGPVTLLVLCLAELLSILLSFGSSRLRATVYLGACLLLFPLKFLDWPFVGRNAFLSMAPSILTVVRKPK